MAKGVSYTLYVCMISLCCVWISNGNHRTQLNILKVLSRDIHVLYMYMVSYSEPPQQYSSLSHMIICTVCYVIKQLFSLIRILSTIHKKHKNMNELKFYNLFSICSPSSCTHSRILFLTASEQTFLHKRSSIPRNAVRILSSNSFTV